MDFCISYMYDVMAKTSFNGDLTTGRSVWGKMSRPRRVRPRRRVDSHDPTNARTHFNHDSSPRGGRVPGCGEERDLPSIESRALEDLRSDFEVRRLPRSKSETGFRFSTSCRKSPMTVATALNALHGAVTAWRASAWIGVRDRGRTKTRSSRSRQSNAILARSRL